MSSTFVLATSKLRYLTGRGSGWTKNVVARCLAAKKYPSFEEHQRIDCQMLSSAVPVCRCRDYLGY